MDSSGLDWTLLQVRCHFRSSNDYAQCADVALQVEEIETGDGAELHVLVGADGVATRPEAVEVVELAVGVQGCRLVPAGPVGLASPAPALVHSPAPYCRHPSAVARSARLRIPDPRAASRVAATGVGDLGVSP